MYSLEKLINLEKTHTKALSCHQQKQNYREPRKDNQPKGLQMLIHQPLQNPQDKLIATLKKEQRVRPIVINK